MIVTTLISIPASIFEWVMANIPGFGILIFIGWCIWKFISWLDSRFAQLDSRFAKIDARFEQIDARFEQIDARFKQMDARFEQIDARFKQIDARFEQIDVRFVQIENAIHKLDTRVAVLETKVDTALEVQQELLARVITLLENNQRRSSQLDHEVEQRLQRLERKAS